MPAVESSESSLPKRVAIIGGGVTGLAAALRLHEAEQDVNWRLFEVSDRLGGVLETVEQDGYRIELSADNFLTREPWATDFCRRVGLSEDLLPTNEERRRALVVHRGRVVPVPEGFVLMAPRSPWPILASPILSPRGKARLAAEPFVPRRDDPDADESVASFARRRLGREVFQRLVQPLVAGIYTADPERLSMAATLPQFLQQEAEHGSLWRAARKSGPTAPGGRDESGARYGLFVAPRFGLQQLVDAAVEHLPNDRLTTNARVSGVTQAEGGRWRLSGQEDQESFDAVIITTPSYAAADLLHDAEPTLADSLASIEYAGASVVCLGVRSADVAKPINGFGFVVPAVERRRLIAASFASYKFPGRAPEDRVLIRVFVGGALQPELADYDDDELIRLAREELVDLVGLRGEPELIRVARWQRRMPQYHVGHLDRVAAIDRGLPTGIHLAGAAYRGVGIPQCIRSGELAAERALEELGSRVAQS